jgi:hypothetical protein
MPITAISYSSFTVDIQEMNCHSDPELAKGKNPRISSEREALRHQ